MKLRAYLRQKYPVALIAGLGGLFTVARLASAQLWTLTSAPVATGELTWNWTAVACSADGTKLVAAGRRGRNCSLGYCDHYDIASPIYASADSGLTWTQTSSPTNVWSAVASSADGSRLATASRSGIYTSTNSDATWTLSSAPTNGWSSVAASAEGTRLVAAAFGSAVGDGLIYTSADSGAHWTQTSAPSNSWSSVASTADGSSFVALAQDHIYTLRFPLPPPSPPPSPRLSITPSSGGLGLSWVVPARSFVLQQNSDLTTTNWTDVGTSPTLNLTNLHYQVAVSRSSGTRFYRLKQQ